MALSNQQLKHLIYLFVRGLITNPNLPLRIRFEALDTIRRKDKDLLHVIELATRVVNTNEPEEARMDALRHLVNIMESGLDNE